jgi:hypothetical protein
MYKIAILLATSVFILFSTSCGQIINSFRKGVHDARRRPPPPRVPAAQVEDVTVGSEPLRWNNDEFDAFEKTIRDMMKKRDFAGLDAMAANFRQKKERFEKGGGWKIHSFYTVVSGPADDTEKGWIQQIKFLEDWKQASPKSIAARSALANAYLGHAWKARGSGYASEIPSDAVPVFEARLQKAVTEIREAAALEERCFGYFETLIRIGVGAGMDRTTLDKVFDEAIVYDKTYPHFYIAKAEYLLPRWYGEPGEMENFAESLTASLGENEGLKMYYLIVDKLGTYKWEGEFFAPGGLSWKRTKKGFTLYEKDHGISRYRLNQFARLTITARDSQAACNTFKRLQGENDFDPEVWSARQHFEEQRKMAVNAMCQIPKFNNQAQ